MAFYLGYKRIAGGAIIGNENSIPIGTITGYLTDNAPKNWLVCDGSAVSRLAYNELFSVIGTTYGSGDGTTTFNLPNLKGKVLVGKDTSQTEFNIIGKTGGNKELQAHIHVIPSKKTAGEVSNVSGESASAGGTGSWCSDNNVTGQTGSGNSGNLQPYIVVNYIIKVTKDVSSLSINEIYKAMWPIGRGFIDFTNTDYSNYLGFTWERELVGMVGVGLDESQVEFNTVGKIGGNKNIQNHNHSLNIALNAGTGTLENGYGLSIGNPRFSINTDNSTSGELSGIGTAKYGTGDSGNLQPYKVVAYWKRVA